MSVAEETHKMNKLASMHKDQLIDRLAERLTFERSIVKVYDAIIGKMALSTDARVASMITQMKQYQGEELEHATWLTTQIEALGGNIDTTTDLSQLIDAEFKGIYDVVLDGDKSVPHMFHALLNAELVDNAGWELLLELADDADDEIAREEFRMRAHQERAHLEFARAAVVAFARSAVLGQEAQLGISA